MIQLPDGFDPSVLTSDFFRLATPFIAVAALIAAGLLIIRTLKRL